MAFGQDSKKKRNNVIKETKKCKPGFMEKSFL